MSTKKIREALKRLSDLEAAANGGSLSRLAHDAGQEVEAIEKAARFITKVDTARAPDAQDMRDAVHAGYTFDSIAKDAP